MILALIIIEGLTRGSRGYHIDQWVIKVIAMVGVYITPIPIPDANHGAKTCTYI